MGQITIEDEAKKTLCILVSVIGAINNFDRASVDSLLRGLMIYLHVDVWHRQLDLYNVLYYKWGLRGLDHSMRITMSI